MIIPDDLTCPSCEEATILLQAAGLPPVSQLIMSAWISMIIQAGASGACFVLAYMYFLRPSPDRDSLYTRFVVFWSCFLMVIMVFVSGYQNIRMETWMARFTAIQFADFWFSQFEHLIFALISFPIMMFLSLRAFNMWGKEDIVGVACIATTICAFACGITSAARGMISPWGLGIKTNQQYAHILLEYAQSFDDYWPLLITSTAFSLSSVVIVSIFIASGLNRHKSTSPELDTAIKRIIFVCGESLLPIFILQCIKLVAVCIQTPDALLVLRPIEQISPAIFCYCFLLSLVSRQRVQHILSAEPVRAVGSFMAALQNSSDAEKAITHPSPAILQADPSGSGRHTSSNERYAEWSKTRTDQSGSGTGSQPSDPHLSVSISPHAAASTSFAPIDLFLGSIPVVTRSEGRMSRSEQGRRRNERLFSTTGGIADEEAFPPGQDERRRSSASMAFHEMLYYGPDDSRGR